MTSHNITVNRSIVWLMTITSGTAAPLAGKRSDQKSPRLVILMSLVTTALSFGVFWLFGYHLWGLVVGLILLS